MTPRLRFRLTQFHQHSVINMWTERHAPHLCFVFSRFSWMVCPEEQTLLHQSSHPQQRTWMECWHWDFQSHNMHRWQPAGSWSNTKKEGRGVSLRRVETFSEGMHWIALYIVTWLGWRAKSRLRTGSKEKIWRGRDSQYCAISDAITKGRYELLNFRSCRV